MGQWEEAWRAGPMQSSQKLCAHVLLDVSSTWASCERRRVNIRECCTH